MPRQRHTYQTLSEYQYHITQRELKQISAVKSKSKAKRVSKLKNKFPIFTHFCFRNKIKMLNKRNDEKK